MVKVSIYLGISDDRKTEILNICSELYKNNTGDLSSDYANFLISLDKELRLTSLERLYVAGLYIIFTLENKLMI